MRRTAWIAVVAGVVILSGCATPPGGSEEPVVVEYDGDLGLLAMTAGDLTVESGCVGLITDDEIRVLLVFPKGVARWEDGHLQYDDEQYTVGERLELAGGGVAVDHPSGMFTDLDIPEGCADWQLWSVTG